MYGREGERGGKKGGKRIWRGWKGLGRVEDGNERMIERDREMSEGGWARGVSGKVSGCNARIRNRGREEEGKGGKENGDRH